MLQPIADWTVERVLALPADGNRYEAVDGQLLVTPAPSLLHKVAAQALSERLAPFVRAATGVPPLPIDLPQLFAEVLDA